MTIVINLCWYDKMQGWIERKKEKIFFYFLLAILILSPTALVFGIALYTETIFSPFNKAGWYLIDWAITGILLLYGVIGTLFLIYFGIDFFKDQNAKKHWFKIKHCDTKQDCD